MRTSPVLALSLLSLLAPEPRAAADEDADLQRALVEAALRKAAVFFRPGDETSMSEMRRQIEAPYDEEQERFKRWIYEEVRAGRLGSEENQRRIARQAGERNIQAKQEHFRRLLAEGRWHEARIVHDDLLRPLWSYADQNDWVLPRTALRKEAYDRCVALYDATLERLERVSRGLVALHGAALEGRLELTPEGAPLRDLHGPGHGLEELRSGRARLEAWEARRGHDEPRWPDFPLLEARWNARISGKDLSGAYRVRADLRDLNVALADEVRARLDDLVRGTLGSFQRAGAGRGTAPAGEPIAVHAGPAHVLFHLVPARHVLLFVRLPGCDATYLHAHADRDWPPELAAINPVVMEQLASLLLEHVADVTQVAPPPAPPRTLVLAGLGPVDLVARADEQDASAATSLRVRAARTDAQGAPIPGARLAFDRPRRGRLDPLEVATGPDGAAQAVYRAPTEAELEAAGLRRWEEVLRVRDPASAAEDDLVVTTRSRRGGVTITPRWPVMPAAATGTQVLTLAFELPPRAGGMPWRAQVRTLSGQGRLGRIPAEEEPSLALDVDSGEQLRLHYRWRGPGSLERPVQETVVVRVEGMQAQATSTFDVGMDLRVRAARRVDEGAVHAVAHTAFRVEIEDAFHPALAASLADVAEAFSLAPGVEVRLLSFAPGEAPDDADSLLSRLRLRFQRDRHEAGPAVPWDFDAGVLRRASGGGEDAAPVLTWRDWNAQTFAPEQAWPGVALLSRGTFRLGFRLRPSVGDARPETEFREAEAPLVLGGYLRFSEELEHTVFLPCLQTVAEIAVAEVGVGVQALLAARDVAVAVRERAWDRALLALYGFWVGRVGDLPGLSEVAKRCCVANSLAGSGLQIVDALAEAGVVGGAPVAKGERTERQRSWRPLQSMLGAAGGRVLLLVEGRDAQRVVIRDARGAAFRPPPARLREGTDLLQRLESSPGRLLVCLEAEETSVVDVPAAAAPLEVTLIGTGQVRSARWAGATTSTRLRAGPGVRLEAQEPGWSGDVARGATVAVAVRTVARGESLEVRYRRTPDFDRSAWVGLIPASVPHGAQRPNDDADLVYVRVPPEPQEGTLRLRVPPNARPGRYEVRMFPSDDDARPEAAASAAFDVR